MHKRTVLLAGILAIMVNSAAAPAKPAAAAASNADDVKACAAKDANKIVAFYTDDAIFIANSPTVTGKAGILEGWKGMVADPNFSLKFAALAVDVAKSGDLAYSHGTYTLTITDPKTKKKMTDKGQYVTVFKKQADGSWK